MDMTKQGYLTSGEFASEIGVSISTLHSWRDKGYIKPALVTPSRRMLFTKEQAEEFNARCRCDTIKAEQAPQKNSRDGADGMKVTKVYVDSKKEVTGYEATDGNKSFKISKDLIPEGTENIPNNRGMADVSEDSVPVEQENKTKDSFHLLRDLNALEVTPFDDCNSLLKKVSEVLEGYYGILLKVGKNDLIVMADRFYTTLTREGIPSDMVHICKPYRLLTPKEASEFYMIDNLEADFLVLEFRQRQGGSFDAVDCKPYEDAEAKARLDEIFKDYLQE